MMNPDQLEVVAHRGVPLLVLAAAGTGKTHALTSRIADLVKRDGVPPQEILAVTFTNKAATEMRKRASALCGVPEADLCISTFHALCARLLRQYHHLLGMRRNFMIYDTNDSLALIRRCMEEMRLTQSRSRNDEYTPQGFLSQIDAWRNDGLEPEAVPPDEYRLVASKSFAHRIYTAYRARCVSCHAVDFSDLILHTLRVLRLDEGAREEVRGRWCHVLVDEFQDTNRAQMQLLDLLLADTTEFMAVGDDCQAIHEWRGAHIQNILRFTDRFPDARTVMLQTNYRSLPQVLELANEVIVKNTMRHDKRLFPSRESAADADVVELHELPTTDAEAAYVAGRVKDMVDAGRRPSDIAVLYRTNVMSVPLETSLAAKGVPFHVRGACPFFGRAEVKDVVAYLRLALNPRSDVDFRRVTNTPPRGMGLATLDKLDAAARAAGMSMYELAVADGARHKKPARFAALLDRLATEIRDPGSRNPVDIVCDVTGLLTGMAVERAENVAALAQSLAAFGGSLQEFVDRVASEEQAAEDDDAVQLMTLHASKGLEFGAVFMVGAAEGILPFYRSTEGAALEEERRLCYVGITRAKDHLVITCPMRRALRFGVVPCVRSRFFNDLNSLRGCCIAHGAPPSR